MLRSHLLSTIAPFYSPPDAPNPGDGDPDPADAKAAAGGDNDAGADDAGGDDGGSPAADASGDNQDDQGSGEPKKAAATADADKKKTKDWRDRQIARQHRQLAEIKAENQRLQEMLNARSQQADDDDDDVEPPPRRARNDDQDDDPPRRREPRRREPTVDRDAEVERRAQQIAAQTEIDRQMGDTIQAGTKSYGKDEFAEALDQLKVLGGFPEDTMMQILATDEPAKVLYELAADPDEYERVMSLSPARRNYEIAKRGQAAKKDDGGPKRPSNAPAPVEPLDNSGRNVQNVGSADLYDPKLDDSRWYALRQKQKAESKGRAWSTSR